ncbi:response regulator [Paraliomyxa miuraensis]|uniref:response regulator n=1 Tax=Paraliomyxa miuraensis TaxID=376150 RepID=UPI00225B2CB6|nr:response regulator [Paraliomyxa miuraensis]MCX4246731.1 response regulator [Paraliomyxa miuraensis]
MPKTTILVVDDEPLIRKLINAILSRRGYMVLEAENGHDGLERFDTHAGIDLVLSDIAMPELDGLGMAQALRARRPALPVLFMSGYTDHDQTGLGEDDQRKLLNKPFTAQQLLTRIEQALGRAS